MPTLSQAWFFFFHIEFRTMCMMFQLTLRPFRRACEQLLCHPVVRFHKPFIVVSPKTRPTLDSIFKTNSVLFFLHQINSRNNTYSFNLVIFSNNKCDALRAAKPDPFFRVEPDFGPKIWVESGRVGPQGRKTGPIGSGWPQIGFKFGFNSIMYPNEPAI